MEHGIYAQSAHQGQEKAQGGAALPAGQDARLSPWGEEGSDLIGLRRDFPNIGAQSLQTGQGGADIPTDAPAMNGDRGPAQCGGDEKPVGIGLGGGNGDPACAGAGENGLIHDRPPSRSQETKSRAGIASTRQRPTASGRMRDKRSPRRFLSDRAARAMAWAEKSVWAGRS